MKRKMTAATYCFSMTIGLWLTGHHLAFAADPSALLLQSLQAEQETHAFSTGLQSFGILLREGFEALLIVSALVVFLKRGKHTEHMRCIHLGVGFAIVASLISAVLFSSIFKHLGSRRDAVEGITLLVTAGVMFYVSYWLIAKQESMRWQHFLRHNMEEAVQHHNAFMLGLTAFLAVFREGAETILFYKALFISSPNDASAIWMGMAAAGFALILLYQLVNRVGHLIPYRLFFTVTALFLYVMSFIFIGKGILELQESGFVGITPIPNFPNVAWLGIFPAWQNVGAQLAFLIPSLGALLAVMIYNMQKRHVLK